MLRKALMTAAASGRVRDAVMSAPGACGIVDRYVAGESSEDAVAAARELRSAGLLVTLDYLGEDTTDARRAAATAAQYVHLLGKLAAEGLTNEQIGERLFISESTVRFHLQKLKAKLGARSKTELIARAIRKGLISPDD